MDPVTHTLTGAALARAGLGRYTPRATAALVLAANAPDIDIFVYAITGEYGALAFRRGWTHGPLAWLVLPFVVVGLVLAWERWGPARRTRASGDGSAADRTRPDDPRGAARAVPLLALAFLGVLTHPALDWLNNYGIRLLMPFSARWFYGDALFIIDPWVWLGLGAAVFLPARRSAGGGWGWALAAAAATALLFVAPLPAAVRVLWLAGLAAILGLRRIGVGRGDDGGRRAATAAATLVGVYILALVAADYAERRIARAAAADAGIAPIRDIMVAPVPAVPFRGEVVVATPEGYRQGRFDWLASPRVRFDRRVDRGAPGLLDVAALRSDDARDFLVWSRYPFARLERSPAGRAILVRDLRYAGEDMSGGLAGLRVDIGDPDGASGCMGDRQSESGEDFLCGATRHSEQ